MKSQLENAMKDILRKALEHASDLGANYADVRFSHLETESISVKNDSVLGVDCHVDWGIGVRVLYDGAWGFASNPDLDDPVRMFKTVQRAVDLAKASAKVNSSIVKLVDNQKLQIIGRHFFTEILSK